MGVFAEEVRTRNEQNVLNIAFSLNAIRKFVLVCYQCLQSNRN